MHINSAMSSVTTAAIAIALIVSFAQARQPEGTSKASRSSSAPQEGAAKDIEVTAQTFAFSPDVIEVNQGDKARLTIRSKDTTHGFEIKKLKIKRKIPKGGEPVAVELDTSQPGTYEIACSEYCGSGHNKMKARLVIKPKAQ